VKIARAGDPAGKVPNFSACQTKARFHSLQGRPFALRRIHPPGCPVALQTRLVL